MKRFFLLRKYLNRLTGVSEKKTAAVAGFWYRLNRAQGDFMDAVSNRQPQRVTCRLVAQLIALIEELDARISAIPGAEQLNSREHQVLFLMLQGASSKELAAQLVLSHSYINNVRSHVRSALGVPIDQPIEEFVRMQIELGGPNPEGAKGDLVESELSMALSALNDAAGCDQVRRDWGEAAYSDIERCTTKLQQWLPHLTRFEAEFADDRIQRERFSPKEWQVIQLTVKGYSSKEIVGIMECSKSNLYRLRVAIRKKLGLRHAESLTAFLIRNALH